MNLHPKIKNQICRHQNQLADLSTKGSVTRDEWNNLIGSLKKHEFPNVFLQPFFFEEKQKHHVDESLAKRASRRACGIETEVGMFGFKKLIERKANLFFTFGCFTRPGESRIGREFCFRVHKDTCARQSPKLCNEFSKVAK